MIFLKRKNKKWKGVSNLLTGFLAEATALSQEGSGLRALAQAAGLPLQLR